MPAKLQMEIAMSDEPTDGERVGYGRPPKHSQFRKGQSGNPAGRPKRVKEEPEPAFPSLHPTRSILREQAQRPVAVREGESRYEISTTEAVVRSLAKQALAGGVLAARTYLEYQAAEDERIAREREESFVFWRDYISRVREELRKAQEQGRSVPDPVPHPDDMVLNYADRTVDINGPITAEDKATMNTLRDMSLLFYELSLYAGDEFEANPETLEVTFSFRFAVFLILQENLPASMRGIPEELSGTEFDLLTLRRREWTERLEARCKELDFDFDVMLNARGRGTVSDIGLGRLQDTMTRHARRLLEKPARKRYRARR